MARLVDDAHATAAEHIENLVTLHAWDFTPLRRLGVRFFVCVILRLGTAAKGGGDDVAVSLTGKRLEVLRFARLFSSLLTQFQLQRQQLRQQPGSFRFSN